MDQRIPSGVSHQGMFFVPHPVGSRPELRMQPGSESEQMQERGGEQADGRLTDARGQVAFTRSFGTTTSNIRRCSLVQSFHGFEGTFQGKTCPSMRIHADRITSSPGPFLRDAPGFNGQAARDPLRGCFQAWRSTSVESPNGGTSECVGE